MERRPTAQEPGNDSSEELAQCQEGEIAGSRRNALQLSRSQNNTPDGSAVRQDGTSEWPRRAGDSTRDVGNKGEKKPQVEGEGITQGDLNPGSAGCARAGAEYSGASSHQRAADSSQPPPPQDPDTEEDDEVRCIIDTAKIMKQSALEALKKALFSEPVHKTKGPQLGRHGSAPPQRPTTLEEPKGPEEPGRQKSPEVQAQEEPPKGTIAAGASYRGERLQDGTAGGQDQPHSAPHLPTRTTQIGSPSPPAAGPSGARTPAPQKMVDSVLNQASGNADRGAGGTVP